MLRLYSEASSPLCPDKMAAMQARGLLQKAKTMLRGMHSQHIQIPAAATETGPARPCPAATPPQATAAGPQSARSGRQERKSGQSLADGPITTASGAGDAGEHDACIVCMEAKVQIVFSPCGHAVACRACSASLAAKSSVCPVCRCEVQKRVHI